MRHRENIPIRFSDEKHNIPRKKMGNRIKKYTRTYVHALVDQDCMQREREVSDRYTYIYIYTT